jgi:hypothetical protein
MNAQVYIQAILDLAEDGTQSDALFVRLSDSDLIAIAKQMDADSVLMAAVKHDNCMGLVDTYLLSIAG